VRSPFEIIPARATPADSAPCSQSWRLRTATWTYRASRRWPCSTSRPPTRTGASRARTHRCDALTGLTVQPAIGSHHQSSACLLCLPPALARAAPRRRPSRSVPILLLDPSADPAGLCSQIFCSTRVAGIPHVALEDRYSVSRVRSLEGFYGVIVSAGYRDAPFDIVSELLPRITQLERLANPEHADARIVEVEDAARNATHIQPNFVLRSMPVPFRPWRWLRRVMIEELYGRLRLVESSPSSVGLYPGD
jgi:hypothetical protein